MRPTLLLALMISCAAAFCDGRDYEGFTEPVRSYEIAAGESGRVHSVLVRRGDAVEPGQLLVSLDADVLKAGRAKVQARVEDKSKVEALRIEHQLKQTRYEKLKELQDSGAGNTEEVRRARADAEVARLNVESAEQERKQGELEVAEIEARVEMKNVRSPARGVVTEILHDPGEFVSLSQPHVLTVVQLHQLRATFFVPTEIATQISANPTITVTLEGSGATAGEIEHVGLVTDAESGRVRVDLLIDNAEGQHRSGVRCTLAREGALQ